MGILKPLSQLILSGLLVATVANTWAAENLYAKNYKEQNTGGLKSLQAEPKTEMFVSNHKVEDNISMLENGYDMIGSSGFEAGVTLPEQALEHGKNIKADTVLVYSKYGSTGANVNQMEFIKESTKKGKELTEADVASKENFIYYASYWAKMPAPLLGIHVIKLAKKEVSEDDAEDKIIYKDGLKILAVIKDSPAAKAGLLKGDVLRKIGNVEVNKAEELSNVVRQHQGKEVALTFERGEETKTAKAKINKR
jgi:PDZ domain